MRYAEGDIELVVCAFSDEMAFLLGVHVQKDCSGDGRLMSDICI